MIKRSVATEAEYRSHHGLNFSKLAAFYHDGNYSPDHALMTIEHKSYFEYGKMFETLLQDTVKGTREFFDRFFISSTQGSLPDKLIQWIDSKEDLESKYNKNKDGSLSKTFFTMHQFLDECKDNPGKIPVTVETKERLNNHVLRMCDMPYFGEKCGDLLARAEWQVPIIWTDERDGLKKKALLDCIVDNGAVYIYFDVKTSADESRFFRMLTKKYWIQDIHYTEGINAVIGPALQATFLVAFKDDPFICQPVMIDYGNIDQRIVAINEYYRLCEAYAEWDKRPRGWLPLGQKKFYLPQN